MGHSPGSQSIELLVVDDTPGDVRLISEAVQDAKLSNPLHVVGDGNVGLPLINTGEDQIGWMEPEVGEGREWMANTSPEQGGLIQLVDPSDGSTRPFLHKISAS